MIKYLLPLVLACGAAPDYTVTSLADPAVRVDLVVTVSDSDLLEPCYEAARAWAPVRTVVCVDATAGLPMALLAVQDYSLGVCPVPDGNWGWTRRAAGEICVRGDARPRECWDAVVPHEVGHALGLSHFGDGLMSARPTCESRVTDEDLEAL